MHQPFLTRHVAPAAAAALLASVMALARPGLLVNLDRAAEDAAVRHTTAPTPSPRVAIVAVDEASLTELGQWPWPRDVVGRLVTALHNGGAAAIAFDILFSEPDRMGVPSATAGGPTSTDAELAAAIARAPVVAGFALTFEDSRLASAASGCVLTPLEPLQRQRGETDLLAGTFEGSGAVCSVAVLRQAARASGAINATPDSDGILRRVPVLARLGGHVYPTLALAAVHVAGHPALILEPRTDGSLRLRLDDRSVQAPPRVEPCRLAEHRRVQPRELRADRHIERTAGERPAGEVDIQRHRHRRVGGGGVRQVEGDDQRRTRQQRLG